MIPLHPSRPRRARRPSALCAVACAGVLLQAAPAATADAPAPAASNQSADTAARTGSLHVLVIPRAGMAAAAVDDLYARLRDEGLLPVGLAERAGVDLPVPTDPPGTADRERARAALLRAKAAFRELDIDTARSAVAAAIDELLGLYDPLDARDLLADALLLRASVKLASGALQNADPDLVLLARLEPQREALDPGLHPPSLVEAFAQARAAERSLPRGALELRPRAAQFVRPTVQVDGIPFDGKEALRAGPHLVVIRAANALSFAQIVSLGDEPLVLEPFLGPTNAAARRAALVQKLSSSGLDDVDNLARTAAVDALLALCGARNAVLLSDGPGPPALARFHEPWQPLELAAPASARDIARAVGLRMRAPAAVAEPAPSPALPIAAAAAGAVAVGAAVGTLVWALWPADPPAPPPSPVLPSCCVSGG